MRIPLYGYHHYFENETNINMHKEASRYTSFYQLNKDTRTVVKCSYVFSIKLNSDFNLCYNKEQIITEKYE